MDLKPQEAQQVDTTDEPLALSPRSSPLRTIMTDATHATHAHTALNDTAHTHTLTINVSGSSTVGRRRSQKAVTSDLKPDKVSLQAARFRRFPLVLREIHPFRNDYLATWDFPHPLKPR
jgi:hypothetical protein